MKLNGDFNFSCNVVLSKAYIQGRLSFFKGGGGGENKLKLKIIN